MSEFRLLTVEQVSELCQVSVRTVYRAISRGSLRASHLGRGGAYRIRPTDLDEWLDGSAVRARRRDLGSPDQRPLGTLDVPKG
jgi:excisionase family DNA binding protein